MKIKISEASKIVGIIAVLYGFLLSIALIGAAFKLFGAGIAQEIIHITSNAYVGLFIGILATSLLQSSSATTSMVVSMVAGDVLTVQNAIPIIMGSNIGTSVTNTLVSVGHIGRKQEFKLAFAASTMHDFFNIFAVLLLFPLQHFTGFLSTFSEKLALGFQNVGGLSFISPIKLITAPVSHWIVDLAGKEPIIILIISLAMLFSSLRLLVKLLKMLLLKRVESFFSRHIFKTPLQGFFFGMVFTVMVQSSSITTSIVIPLAAAGILTLYQIYPYTLGANIGTTITAILASLVSGAIEPVTVAFSHLLFNLSGIALIYPFKKIRHLPIDLARILAEKACQNRWVPLLYVLCLFFLIPLALIWITR
ncbi:MAG: Na/Pi symporter [Magnetococcales bacterium]|nr:Na/Pi symporter [Magnetococcales bacterium]